ncbi:unnamed protein product [Prorocentrum cordatum]|uniref:Uncharacterized protein n=1 Tax=Prorocentrum cordatum TaxID=2364126 RepID=A0ABN9W9T3_9DINO|nr:unnamed protein product [Polarella glacialis]
MSNMYNNAWETARAVSAIATGSTGKEDKWGVMKTAAGRAAALISQAKDGESLLGELPPELAKFFGGGEDGDASKKLRQAKGRGKGKDTGPSWFCSCGFSNKGTNEVCGGWGPLGCKKPRPRLLAVAGQVTA